MEAAAVIDRRRLKRQLTFWRLVSMIVLIMLSVVTGTTLFTKDTKYVARLTLEGFIVEDHLREERVRQIAKDGNALALIVRVNSPGGTTTGAEGLFHALRNVAAKKPVVAVIGTIGASGGYISALAADHIIARETSMTGSIGVLMQSGEITGLMDKLGIKTQTIKSSPVKGTPSPIEPMSKETRVAFELLIEDGYNWFKDLVKTRRSLTDTEVEIVADGRVFSGRQALKLKLIDNIGGEVMARDWLARLHDIPHTVETIDIRLDDGERILEKIFNLGSQSLFWNKSLSLDGLIAVWQPK